VLITNKKRKICCITGSRGDYGYLRPIMQKINKDLDLELISVAIGMHSLKKFGKSIEEVKKDFPEVIEVPLKLQEDTGYGTTKYLSEAIMKISKILKQTNPDLVLLLGDRTEIFAATQAAAFQNIPIAHLHGGDKSSGLDEPIRHSITKFAQIHFPATKKSAQRIKNMGEEPHRIFLVGSSTLDEILNFKPIERKELFHKYDLNSEKPFLLIIYHPITAQKNQIQEKIKILLNAVLKTKIQTLILYPNNDEGGQLIIDNIKQFEEKNLIYKQNLPRKDFLSLLKQAEILIGNSSSGIIEAPSFKLPVINLGIRQKNREKAENVIDIENFNEENILHVINYALKNKKFRKKLKNCKNPYGDGHASERICNILKKIKLDQDLLQKKIIY